MKIFRNSKPSAPPLLGICQASQLQLVLQFLLPQQTAQAHHRLGRRDMSYPQLISKQTQMRKAKPTKTEGEQACSFHLFSPAVGLSSAPGAAAEEGSAVLARSAHLPPC